MSQLVFGSGEMWARSAGNASTPVQFGSMQNVALNLTFSTDERRGRNLFPLIIARGHAKLSGTAQFASITARLFSDVVMANAALSSPGITRTAVWEAASIDANQSFTVFNNATFVRDLGVLKADNLDVWQRVLSLPIGRQYACNESTGVYTFDVGNENRPMLVSYNYLDAAGRGVPIANVQAGAATPFTLVLSETFNGKAFTVVLNACVCDRFNLQNRLEDFVLPSVSFTAMADANGVIGTLSFDENDDLYIVSGPYAIAAMDGFNTGVTFLHGQTVSTVPETLNMAMTWVGGTLSDGLRNYSNGVPENFNTSVTWVDGNLQTVLRSYSNGVPEAFNTSMAWVGGNMQLGLQQYTNGLPEQFNVSVAFVGGTLS